MQIQKTTGQSKNISLFGPNFKINSHSVRTIHRYLQHSHSEQHIDQNLNQMASLSSLNSPVDKRLLAKTLIRTTSSQLPEFRALNSPSGLSKGHSFDQFSKDQYLRQIQRLSRQTEEQRVIIELQEELIKKLADKLQGNSLHHSNIQHQVDIKEEREEGSKLYKLAKIKELLESSLRSL